LIKNIEEQLIKNFNKKLFLKIKNIKTTSEVIQLVTTGAKIIIDANNYTTSEIISIVGNVGLKGSQIVIKNASSKSNSDLLMILSHYPNNVTIEL
jgi:hypothetical protein